MIRHLRAALAGAVLVLCAMAAPAFAGRTIVTDNPPPYEVTPGCLFGDGGCGGIDMGFSFNLGNGPISRIYAYDDGVIGLGAPVANEGSTTISGFGVPVLVPGMVPVFFDPNDITYDSNDYFFRVVNSFDTSVANQITVTFATRYGCCSKWQAFAQPFDENSVTIAFDPASRIVTISFDYSESFNWGYGTYPKRDAVLQGYDVGGAYLSGETVGAYSGLSFTLQAVPEPAAWMSMIAGFGLVGAAMRRGRRERAVAA